MIFIFRFPSFYDAENGTTWKLIVFSWTASFFDGYSGYLSDLYRIFTFHIRILSFIAMLRMVNKIKIYSWSYLLWHSWAWRIKKVDLSLGVSNVIDIAEILFAFLIRFLPHLIQKYLECKTEKWSSKDFTWYIDCEGRIFLPK